MLGEKQFIEAQRPFEPLDQEAFIRHLGALSFGKDELPEDFHELTKMIQEARRQAVLFIATFRTPDFNLELEVYRLLSARDKVSVQELRKYL